MFYVVSFKIWVIASIVYDIPSLKYIYLFRICAATLCVQTVSSQVLLHINYYYKYHYRCGVNFVFKVT